MKEKRGFQLKNGMPKRGRRGRGGEVVLEKVRMLSVLRWNHEYIMGVIGESALSEWVVPLASCTYIIVRGDSGQTAGAKSR